MPKVVTAVLFALLVLVRVPSLAQPAGADQGLYAYVGQRILAGGLPYVDAWDQKPPAIHYTYAAMYALWPDGRVVAATDLAVAVLTTLGLMALGRRLLPASGAGAVSGLLFLALSNPVFGRLGGVRVRAQCEVFIACAVVFALVAAARAGRIGDERAYDRSQWWALVAGVLVGVAATYKYNAAAYALPVAFLLIAARVRERRSGPRTALLWAALGGAIPVLAAIGWFGLRGGLADLYQATIAYNLRYSGETYAGPLDLFRYLVSFPVAYSWLDSLWWMGGLASAVLSVVAWWRPALGVAPFWVAAACLTIAVNGSRGLPQYFVQAGPALALASGLALALAWSRVSRVPRVVLVALLATGVWRVTNIPKAIEYTWHDVSYLRGAQSERDYLARFGNLANGDKYSALAVRELATDIGARTTGDDTVLLFGFTPGALVESRRMSATRFFWSRPVIVGFNDGVPGYGVSGMLEELRRTRPALVLLQRRDWDPDGPDSATFFQGNAALMSWLRDGYREVKGLAAFSTWERIDRTLHVGN